MLNYLKQDEETARKAYHEVDCFHDLIMDMSKSFARAYELGMDPGRRRTKKTNGNKGNQRNGRGRDQTSNAGSDRKKDGDPDNPDKGGGDSKLKPCVWCNGMHLLKKCPTLPEHMKEWPWWKVLKERKKVQRASGNNNAGTPRNVRFKKTGSENVTADPGGETAAPKKRLATKATKVVDDRENAAEKSWAVASQIGADGTAVVAWGEWPVSIKRMEAVIRQLSGQNLPSVWQKREWKCLSTTNHDRQNLRMVR